MAETPLEMMRRHVVEGTARVERQREILAELERDGHPIEDAEKVLETLLETQRLADEHLHLASK